MKSLINKQKPKQMKKGKNEVAIIDNSIPSALAILETEFSNLKKVQETPYKVWNAQVMGINDIRQETNVGNLVKAYSGIKAREEAYNQAQIELGLSECPAFEIGGGNSKDWKEAISLRIQVLTQEQRYKELSAMKKELEALMDKEDKKKLAMEKLANLLK